MSENQLIAKDVLADAKSKLDLLVGELNKVLLGKPQIVEKVVIAVLAQGHLLLEGLPGLGKTELVKGLAKCVELPFHRVQFTPDLMPGDITGTMVLEENEAGKRVMQFHQGPVFTSILLADEINRASPKTQASLLEAMAERQVSVLGKHYSLEEPFLVLATQNPIDMEGTYPLPEAQLDRFLFKLYFTEVSEEVLEKIIEERTGVKDQVIQKVMGKSECLSLIHLVKKVYLPKEVGRYVARIVAATHPDERASQMIRQYVKFGCSPRAAINLSMAAKAKALIYGRDSVGFEDIKSVAKDILHHRIHLNYQAGLDQVSGDSIVDHILEKVPEVKNEILNRS